MQSELDEQIIILGNYHHHYHYQSSWQQLCLAEAFRALGERENAIKAYKAALFQDHLNIFAKAALSTFPENDFKLPNYQSHPKLEKVFYKNIGKNITEASNLHDAAMEDFSRGNLEKAKENFLKALELEPDHSNSHAGLGIIYFTQKNYLKAKESFEQAIKFGSISHDNYHKQASDLHFRHGKEFYKNGEIDLAITDMNKALDLHRNNDEALQFRAELYREKEISQ